MQWRRDGNFHTLLTDDNERVFQLAPEQGVQLNDGPDEIRTKCDAEAAEITKRANQVSVSFS